jgi:hypothetical protein
LIHPILTHALNQTDCVFSDFVLESSEFKLLSKTPDQILRQDGLNAIRGKSDSAVQNFEGVAQLENIDLK